MGSDYKILIVEDNVDSAEVLRDILTDEGFSCDIATTGKEALMMSSSISYGLILLDIMLPDISGFEILEKIRITPFTAFTPVILLTALNDSQSLIKGYSLGCNDFVSKPYNRLELIARVKSLIRLKKALDDLEDTNNVLFTLASTIEAKDPYTRGHSQRVSIYCWELAHELGWKDSEAKRIERAGLLHDIGKIGVPDHILTKPDKLTPEEFELIKTHPVLSAEICKPLAGLRTQIPAIKYHHERLDGKGYPEGIEGEKIPVGARIMAICDAWDAMTSDRAYRKRMSKSEALDVLREFAGTQWDKNFVEKFIKIVKEKPG
ncbi:MAG: response regulator [Elusimicrobia bacterium]|nr:response regulator [Elusimicrobiota bacterium]